MIHQLPYTHHINLNTGEIPGARLIQTRHLSDLRGLFADPVAETVLVQSNPLIYQVFETEENPAVEGQMRFSTTIIQPGKVGGEYFFTKGHYHAKSDRAELYYGLKGQGILLLQTRAGEVSVQPMHPGSAAFVPPHWGHRTINTSPEPFAFLAVYPADAGYDYGSIAERGFAEIIVEQNGVATAVPNSRWKP
jgi:glucose-6-phosphate isomerase